MPATSRLRRNALLLLAVTFSAVTLAGCSTFDDLLGINSSSKTIILTPKSISLRSDSPANAADPTGAAVIGSAGTVRFTVIGTFSVNASATLQTNDVSAGVVWQSTNPTLALPGADGRVVGHGSAGVASITATSPAHGDIPALTSNSISLTIQ